MWRDTLTEDLEKYGLAEIKGEDGEEWKQRMEETFVWGKHQGEIPEEEEAISVIVWTYDHQSVYFLLSNYIFRFMKKG